MDRVSEPTAVGGVFGRVMAEASAAKAKHLREGTYDPPRNTTETERRSMLASQAARRATAWGLPPETWRMTFDSFDLAAASLTLRRAHREAQALVGAAPKLAGLLLWGNAGTGKTHLAYAAANHCRERAWPFLFRRVPDLMSQLRSAIKAERRNDPDALSADDVIRLYAGEMLLVLDDLGAHQDTEYAAAVLYDVIDARYRKRLPTIITTNLRPDQIDPRIASRYGLGTLACEGPDQRRRYG